MGGMCSKSKPPPTEFDTTRDPVTGMSENDRYLIVESWKTIGPKKVIKENGVEFFLLLFSEYPYTQSYFGILKDMKLSELHESPKMKVHAAAVFHYIGNYVEHIDDSETLLGLMEKLARSHIGRGINFEEIEKVRLVYQNFLLVVMGDDCSPELIDAWDRLMKMQSAAFVLMAKDLSSERTEGDEAGARSNS